MKDPNTFFENSKKKKIEMCEILISRCDLNHAQQPSNNQLKYI